MSEERDSSTRAERRAAKRQKKELKKLKKRMKKAAKRQKSRASDETSEVDDVAPAEERRAQDAWREKLYSELEFDQWEAGVYDDSGWSDCSDDAGDFFENIARRWEEKRRLEAEAKRRARVSSRRSEQYAQKERERRDKTPPGRYERTPPTTPPPTPPRMDPEEAERKPQEVTHYELLGVACDAPAPEIRKAYYRLARAHHPDKAVDVDQEQAAIAMAALNNAHEVLSDPIARQRYDQALGLRVSCR